MIAQATCALLGKGCKRSWATSIWSNRPVGHIFSMSWVPWCSSKSSFQSLRSICASQESCFAALLSGAQSGLNTKMGCLPVRKAQTSGVYVLFLCGAVIVFCSGRVNMLYQNPNRCSEEMIPVGCPNLKNASTILHILITFFHSMTRCTFLSI